MSAQVSIWGTLVVAINALLLKRVKLTDGRQPGGADAK